ncbi:MAG: hypothetical protein V4450_14230 [Bacteroidota bacterium]
MSIRNHIKKLTVVTLLLMGMQVTYAAFSFTGIADEKTKTSKYSLKNLSSLAHKGLSFNSLKSSLQYKGAQSNVKETVNGNGSEVNSMLRFDNGNTSYIYPYKFKVKAPKFKTPAPPQN